MQITMRRGIRVTPQQFGERFSMLQRLTGARDTKQQAALARSLSVFPNVLRLLPDTLQSKTRVLKEQFQQQLGVDPERTQQLISKHPRVLEYQAESLVQKAKEQGKLLELEGADVVTQSWMRGANMLDASTSLLHKHLAQLQQLLQPYMSPADMRQLVLSQPNLLATHSADAVRVRLAALEECLRDWSPQQLGAALLKYPNVLQRSPDTIRYKWHVAKSYRDMHMLCTLQREQQPQQQQLQQQPQQAFELGILIRTKERFAMLEYIMEEQQQQECAEEDDSSSSSSMSSSGVKSGSERGGGPARPMPPAVTVLTTPPRLFQRLVQEHYPGFWQWYKQRQQEEKKTKQQVSLK
jgi:hypothetical protein